MPTVFFFPPCDCLLSVRKSACHTNTHTHKLVCLGRDQVLVGKGPGHNRVSLSMDGRIPSLASASLPPSAPSLSLPPASLTPHPPPPLSPLLRAAGRRQSSHQQSPCIITSASSSSSSSTPPLLLSTSTPSQLNFYPLYQIRKL